MGMVAATELSVRKGLLAREDALRLRKLLEKLGLPTRPPVPMVKITAAMRKDKKRAGDSLHFILLNRIGQAVIDEIPIAELQELFNADR